MLRLLNSFSISSINLTVLSGYLSFLFFRFSITLLSSIFSIFCFSNASCLRVKLDLYSSKSFSNSFLSYKNILCFSSKLVFKSFSTLYSSLFTIKTFILLSSVNDSLMLLSVSSNFLTSLYMLF